MGISFVTGNIGKVRELKEILKIDLEQVALEVPEIQAIDIVDIIKFKAEKAYENTGTSVLVEDTGLYFEAWRGLPGALIKWFMETVGSDGICKMMDSETNRKVTAKCVFDYYDGDKHHIFSGSIAGIIPSLPCGEGGFGWDNIFIPNGYNQTFSQMSKQEKNNISMRKEAIEKLRLFIESKHY
jgi:non-canonical purine NTP pyrophosphatase (RdgB/HAM1 family)